MTLDAVPEVVNTERRGSVLVVTIANPPVNALGVDVRRGLVRSEERRVGKECRL